MSVMVQHPLYVCAPNQKIKENKTSRLDLSWRRGTRQKEIRSATEVVPQVPGELDGTPPPADGVEVTKVFQVSPMVRKSQRGELALTPSERGLRAYHPSQRLSGPIGLTFKTSNLVKPGAGLAPDSRGSAGRASQQLDRPKAAFAAEWPIQLGAELFYG